LRKLRKGQLARVKMGLTLREVASQVGVAEGYICAILSGRMRPSQETLKKIGKVLNINPEELLDEVQDQKQPHGEGWT
jgi:transcriptional regulator with XRE-family HTH domain